MKKIAAMLIALMLLCSACACALVGSGYPAWDGSNAPANSLCARFGADSLQLDFDSGAEFSYISEGKLTACFFAFDSAQQNYLEMYLQMPENLAAGDVFSSADGTDASSVSLYEVSLNGESLYFAGQLIGNAYPGGSSYEIRIDSAVQENGSLNISGSLNAKLCKIVNSVITDEFLDVQDGAFRFSLPIQKPVQPEESAAPLPTQKPFATPEASQLPLPTATPQLKFPAYTMDPHPAFTLPPDYRVL